MKQKRETSEQRPTTVRKIVEIPINEGVGSFITFAGLSDPGEHLAIAFGEWQEDSNPLVRIHSECLTGDVFGSGLCDCGEQLREAIKLMQVKGGIILYLRQEGRGIGLYNKLDAYGLQEQGYDTFEANQALGLSADQRDYAVAAQMLRALAKGTVRLLTNNPEKERQLKALGIRVSAVKPTGVFLKPTNHAYLSAKKKKAGHLLALPPKWIL